MATTTDDNTPARGKLIVRDSVAFVSLLLLTIVIFTVTLLLFRSFSAHRADLAQRLSDQGVQAMQNGKPGEAIVALRTALSYAPETRQYELLLAQALGEAGRTEESYNYFLGLWEAQPGNGFINLELARLAARRNDRQAAVNFYRASIYGTWEGDGSARRPEVRLELARYLIDLNSLAAARTELTIAGGNLPDTPDSDTMLGRLFEQANDPANALNYYRKALADRPDDLIALTSSGRLAYRSGDFAMARKDLEQAQNQASKSKEAAPWTAADDTLLRNSTRILDLIPARSLSTRERVAHILAARAIAKKRLDDCSAQLTALSARWAGPDATANAATLARDTDRQDSTMQLIDDTERQAAQRCGPPSGDDALLLLLANTSMSSVSPNNPEASQ